MTAISWGRHCLIFRPLLNQFDGEYRLLPPVPKYGTTSVRGPMVLRPQASPFNVKLSSSSSAGPPASFLADRAVFSSFWRGTDRRASCEYHRQATVRIRARCPRRTHAGVMVSRALWINVGEIRRSPSPRGILRQLAGTEMDTLAWAVHTNIGKQVILSRAARASGASVGSTPRRR